MSGETLTRLQRDVSAALTERGCAVVDTSVTGLLVVGIDGLTVLMVLEPDDVLLASLSAWWTGSAIECIESVADAMRIVQETRELQGPDAVTDDMLSSLMDKARKPRVLNKRKHGVPRGAVYVGRPSKWGNPLVAPIDGGRPAEIKRYRTWLESQPQLIEAAKRELAGKDLVCWCAPLRCHADVLLEVANGFPPRTPTRKRKRASST